MSKETLKLPADRNLRDRASCEDCRFAGLHESNDQWRYCRAHAPDFSPMNGRALWPVTKIEDWCGEFRND